MMGGKASTNEEMFPTLTGAQISRIAVHGRARHVDTRWGANRSWRRNRATLCGNRRANWNFSYVWQRL